MAEPKDFSTTQLLNLGFKSIFQRGRAENDEIPKSPFQFQPQTKNGKIVLIYCFILTFLPFLFVVEMEMTILGSRNFLLFPSQIQFLSLQSRICVVIKNLDFFSEFFISILIFENPWLSELLTPPQIISCPVNSCLNSSTFQRLEKFLMEMPGVKALVSRLLELLCPN